MDCKIFFVDFWWYYGFMDFVVYCCSYCKNYDYDCINVEYDYVGVILGV